MLKGFGSILVKEVKELVRDPKILVGMIIVPLIMFPLLGGIMSFSVQSAQEQAQKAEVLVVNNDGSSYFSQNFTRFLESLINVAVVVNNTSPENVSSQGLLAKYDVSSFIVIPRGFSENMTEHLTNPNVTASIEFYGAFSAGVFGSIGSSTIDVVVSRYNRFLAPDFVIAEKSTIVKGQIAQGVDPAVLSSLVFSQAIATPITILILLTYSMQIAATSVAMEKEEKTLETLLTLPVDRFSILMGKLSSSILVAGAGALAYMVGFVFFTSSLTSSIPGTASLNLVELGLVPSIFGYLLLGISLFVTLLSALALAVILSAFSEDVRGAQSLVGYIYPLIFIPSFLLIYVDIGTLPLWLQAIVFAIPYSQPVLASKAVTLGDYGTAILGIVYVTALTVVILYVASRLFATEKILTAKLRFRGLRKREKGSLE